MIEGFLSFAPDLAAANEGFFAGYFEQLAALEPGNFWFRARNQLITWAIGRYFAEAKNFLEIGCGTGFVLSGIEKQFPSLSLSGSEIYSTALTCASTRTRNAQLFQMDARRIPFADEFDVIGAFDVLEHIENDLEVLQQMHKAVRPGGGIIITVPQHKFLWSCQDEHACHVRRYSLSGLRQKAEEAGFHIVRTTSFVSFLLSLMMLSRLAKNSGKNNPDVMAELKIGKSMNAILESVLGLERGLIRSGINFPFGGSLLLIARKR